MLNFANNYQLPLITTEGYTSSGVKLQGLRKRAKECGVQVFTPKEFWWNKIDDKKEASFFLDEFQRATPVFLQSNPTLTIARESLLRMEGYFEHILFGKTEGLMKPVVVSISDD